MPKGKYQYQVVENAGTDLEFVCRTFDIEKDAFRFISELYEPQDYQEMTISVRRIVRRRQSRPPVTIPPGTNIDQERRNDTYRYIARAGNIARYFSSRPAAARWLNKHFG